MATKSCQALPNVLWWQDKGWGVIALSSFFFENIALKAIACPSKIRWTPSLFSSVGCWWIELPSGSVGHNGQREKERIIQSVYQLLKLLKVMIWCFQQFCQKQIGAPKTKEDWELCHVPQRQGQFYCKIRLTSQYSSL